MILLHQWRQVDKQKPLPAQCAEQNYGGMYYDSRT
nr:MAG TPA: hypothetical protein [Caudoviricetes sp.]